MSLPGLLQIAVFFVILLAITKPVGLYMVHVFAGERTFLSPIMQPVERFIYRFGGVDSAAEQPWTTYAVAMLFLNLAGLLFVYAFQRLQQFLPLNPQGLGPVNPDLAFNTAVS